MGCGRTAASSLGPCPVEKSMQDPERRNMVSFGSTQRAASSPFCSIQEPWAWARTPSCQVLYKQTQHKKMVPPLPQRGYSLTWFPGQCRGDYWKAGLGPVPGVVGTAAMEIY
ncbi:unnamed protein product [Caretta caretta]